MSNELTEADPLGDWFRRIGTGLSDEDYEAGIKAMAARETALRAQIAKEAKGAVLGGFLERFPTVSEQEAYFNGRYDAALIVRYGVEWTRARIAEGGSDE